MAVRSLVSCSPDVRIAWSSRYRDLYVIRRCRWEEASPDAYARVSTESLSALLRAHDLCATLGAIARLPPSDPMDSIVIVDPQKWLSSYERPTESQLDASSLFHPYLECDPDDPWRFRRTGRRGMAALADAVSLYGLFNDNSDGFFDEAYHYWEQSLFVTLYEKNLLSLVARGLAIASIHPDKADSVLTDAGMAPCVVPRGNDDVTGWCMPLSPFGVVTPDEVEDGLLDLGKDEALLRIGRRRDVRHHFSVVDGAACLYIVLVPRPGEGQRGAFDGLLRYCNEKCSCDEVSCGGVPGSEVVVAPRPESLISAIWSKLKSHPGYRIAECRRCGAPFFESACGGPASFCGASCRSAYSKGYRQFKVFKKQAR